MAPMMAMKAMKVGKPMTKSAIAETVAEEYDLTQKRSHSSSSYTLIVRVMYGRDTSKWPPSVLLEACRRRSRSIKRSGRRVAENLADNNSQGSRSQHGDSSRPTGGHGGRGAGHGGGPRPWRPPVSCGNGGGVPEDVAANVTRQEYSRSPRSATLEKRHCREQPSERPVTTPHDPEEDLWLQALDRALSCPVEDPEEEEECLPDPEAEDDSGPPSPSDQEPATTSVNRGRVRCFPELDALFDAR